MLKIGLTGGIGSGKTTVSDLFSKLGIPIIDTDIIAHELVNNKIILKEIITSFGNKIINIDGSLDRKALSKLVFNNPENKQKIEDILHPEIRSTVNEKIHQLDLSDQPPAYVIIVVPLLIETNFDRIIDRTLVIMSDENIRIERIKSRDDRNMSEIHAILAAQATDQQRIDKADDIIENNSNIKQLDLQVQKLHNKYRTLAASIE